MPGHHASKQCTNDSLRLVCSGISPTIPGRAALLELLNSCTSRPNTTSLITPLGRHGVSVFRYTDLQYSSRCPVGPQVTLYFGSRAAPSEPLAGGVKVRSPAGAAERGFCVLKTWQASDCNASNPLLGALRKKTMFDTSFFWGLCQAWRRRKPSKCSARQLSQSIPHARLPRSGRPGHRSNSGSLLFLTGGLVQV